MLDCPYCKSPLSDMNSIMDMLSKNKINGELEFRAECCGGRLKAYSRTMAYYLEPMDLGSDGSRGNSILIGCA